MIMSNGKYAEPSTMTFNDAKGNQYIWDFIDNYWLDENNQRTNLVPPPEIAELRNIILSKLKMVLSENGICIDMNKTTGR